MIQKIDSTPNTVVCFLCGVCCTDFQPYLKLPEAQAVAEHLGETWLDFQRRYVDKRWPFADSILLRHEAGACVFLDRSENGAVGLCSIESFKPECCREWQAGLGKKQCRAGLLKYWNLTVDDDEVIHGSPESIQQFKTFLDSLE